MTTTELRHTTQNATDPFQFLKKQLGEEPVIKALDTQKNPFEWTKPDDLPADVVKGVHQEAPFLAVRFQLPESDVLAFEVFHQKFTRPSSPEIFEAGFRDGKVTGCGVTPVSAEQVTTVWASKSTAGVFAIGGKQLSPTKFKVLKGVLEGRPMHETGGRCLPIKSKEEGTSAPVEKAEVKENIPPKSA